jgi:hypothetical protein
MTIVEEITKRLANYPHAVFQADSNGVTVEPGSENGFRVSLTLTGDGFLVWFDGWHEEFEDEQEALNCFAFGLSAECRLRVTAHGGFRHKWTVEYLRNGVWQEDSSTGLIFFPFFLPKKVLFLQNDLIRAT